MSRSLSLPESSIGPGAHEARVERAIARRSTAAPNIPWEQVRESVSALVQGRMLPQGLTPEAAVVAIAKGAELGIPPFQAVAAIPVINGRPTLEAKLMLALAFKRLPGFDYQVVRWDRGGCSLLGRRSPHHSQIEVTFDTEDAKAAGLLGKGPWKAHPKAMFFARAAALLCRAIAPDVFSGLYAPDEVDDLPQLDLDAIEPLTPLPEPQEPEVESGAVDATFEPQPDDWRTRALAAVLELAAEPEVKKAAKLLGMSGRKVVTWTDAEIEGLCREVGGPLAAYVRSEPPREPGDESEEDPFA